MKEIGMALAITFVIVVPAEIFLDYRLPGLASVALYLIIYVVVSRVVARRNVPENVVVKPADWPASGPIGRFGQTGLALTFTLTGLLAFFNPFQLVQIVLQFVGNVYLQLQQERTVEEAAAYQNKATYTLPVTGEWVVINGGTTPQTSHSWDVLTQRYAYDFVQADDDLQRHSGEGTRVTDYFCYGQTIVAAADGTVVKVLDDIRDAPFVGYGIVDFLARSFVGNHVIVRHAEGEYGLYAHLIKGSVPVKVGDMVQRGQVIGRCGHSGHSTEPHLHVHLQDRENFFFAMGLPVRFTDVVVNGQAVDEVSLTSGDRVRPCGDDAG